MSTVFFKGVVVDVLNSTSPASATQYSEAENKNIVTSEFMKNFPRNTIVVKTISEGLAKRADTRLVCYPFFSSHLCMPLKVGEYVWFIYEDPGSKGSIAYWLSRVSEPNHVEDVNYTFASRTFVQSPTKQRKKASDKFDAPAVDDGEIQTYSWQSPTSDPEELVRLIELAKNNHRFEKVPRYTKRPGDLILQGSNNSLIMLGEERGHSAPNSSIPSTSANEPAGGIPPGSTAIDIVVGRGSKTANGKFGVTGGKSLVNELGIEELDKRNDFSIEGDAHFKADASRIYLTANSSDPNATYHPDKLLGVVAPATSQNMSSAGSFVVVASDNLRLVSRERGSIRIFKEQSFGANDGAAIMMHSNGEIHIAGSRLNLSSYSTANPVEPYVKYSVLKSLLTSLLTDIDTFCTVLSTHVTPGFGAPSPQITAAAAALQFAAKSKLGALSTNKVLVNGVPTDISSTTIFGE